jgi:hypothetical protein
MKKIAFGLILLVVALIISIPLLVITNPGVSSESWFRLEIIVLVTALLVAIAFIIMAMRRKIFPIK